MAYGDSGTFGSKSDMDKIARQQSRRKSFKPSSPINPKWTSKNIRTRLDNLANKLFFK